ncbi:MAG: helix-turn-helix domain-containing protein [Bariatricus sp.]
MDWIIGLQKAIDYIENNLTETIDYEMVAAQCFSSSYHFQRVFSILCGFTIGEYIRNRRLSLAGKELAMSDAKVMDVALKYGYESPDSFAKAFQKFHGILPSQARNNGNNLKSFSRLVLKFSLEGGSTMNYRIEEKEAMVITGYSMRFTGSPSDRYNQQHDFMVCGDTRFMRFALQAMASDCSKEYAVVSNIDDDGYEFTIGTIIPNCFSEHLEDTIGESNANKLTVQTVSAKRYLIVETERSATCIQEHLEIRKRAITEWFTGSEYQLADAPEITLFHYDRINKENSYIELWLPIEKI